MTPTINGWIAQEKSAFDNFNDFVAIRLEDGIFRALAEKMKNDIAAKKTSVIALPWGTYTADIKVVGEAGNITPAFEPSKLFKKLLNDDGAVSRDLRQESFDPEYVKLFQDYVAFGYFYPDTNPDVPGVEKGLRLTDDEVDYFLNGYLDVLVTIGRDKQRAGKTYRLEIDEGFPHGSFDFVYNDTDKDDSIEVKFVPSKSFKQYLKNDTLASGSADAKLAAAASLSPLMGKKKLFSKLHKEEKKALKKADRDTDGFMVLNKTEGSTYTLYEKQLHFARLREQKKKK